VALLAVLVVEVEALVQQRLAALVLLGKAMLVVQIKHHLHLLLVVVVAQVKQAIQRDRVLVEMERQVLSQALLLLMQEAVVVAVIQALALLVVLAVAVQVAQQIQAMEILEPPTWVAVVAEQLETQALPLISVAMAALA
jgi:hypothetical protein